MGCIGTGRICVPACPAGMYCDDPKCASESGGGEIEFDKNPCCPDPCTEMILKDGPKPTDYPPQSIRCRSAWGSVAGGTLTCTGYVYYYGCEPIKPPPPGCATTTTTTTTTTPRPPSNDCDGAGG